MRLVVLALTARLYGYFYFQRAGISDLKTKWSLRIMKIKKLKSNFLTRNKQREKTLKEQVLKRLSKIKNIRRRPGNLNIVKTITRRAKRKNPKRMPDRKPNLILLYQTHLAQPMTIQDQLPNTQLMMNPKDSTVKTA